ncbi:13818_t:CDS:1, partial [Funneliformis caledonium]
SNEYYDTNFNNNVSLEQKTILSNFERLSNVSRTSFDENVNTNADTHIVKRLRHKGSGGSVKRSFVWKFFDEKDNPSGPGKIMACKNLLSNGKLCTVTYAALDSTSNTIQHLANIHGILDENKVHIK